MNVVETARTLVDDITLDDAAFFVALLNSPDWLRYIGDRHVSNIHDACRYLEDGFLKSYRDHGFGYYVVRTRPDGVPMGICGFLRKPSLEHPDFGFAFLPDYYGQGFAIESCRAVLDFGMKTFGFQVLDAVTTQHNPRSMRLLEKLGFRRHGTVDGVAPENQLALYRWHREA